MFDILDIYRNFGDPNAKEDELDLDDLPVEKCKYAYGNVVKTKQVDHFMYEDGSLHLSPHHGMVSREEKEFQKECLRNIRSIPLCPIYGEPVKLVVDPSFDYDEGCGILRATFVCENCKKG